MTQPTNPTSNEGKEERAVGAAASEPIPAAATSAGLRVKGVDPAHADHFARLVRSVAGESPEAIGPPADLEAYHPASFAAGMRAGARFVKSTETLFGSMAKQAGFDAEEAERIFRGRFVPGLLAYVMTEGFYETYRSTPASQNAARRLFEAAYSERMGSKRLEASE